MNSVENAARRLLEPVTKMAAAYVVRRYLGHWMCTVLVGNREHQQMYGFSRSDVYNQDRDFAKLFGAPVAEYRFHPEDAQLLIEHLVMHQDPDTKRIFGANTPAANRLRARIARLDAEYVDAE